MAPRALQLKMGPEDQQHLHHLGACEKGWMSVPALDLISQNVRFGKVLDDLFAH